MKKFNLIALGLGLFAIGYFSTSNVKASSSGICCKSTGLTCDHPIGIPFEDSRWVSGASTCTGHEEPPVIT